MRLDGEKRRRFIGEEKMKGPRTRKDPLCVSEEKRGRESRRMKKFSVAWKGSANVRVGESNEKKGEKIDEQKVIFIIKT